MSKYKAITIPIYNGVCWFYSGNEKACAEHFTKKHKGPKTLFSTERLGACFVQNGASNVAIYIKNHINYSTLAHEVFHATTHIMNEAGIELANESEEAYAYLISFFMDEWIDKSKWKII